MEDLKEYDKLLHQKKELESNPWKDSEEVNAKKKEEIEKIKTLMKQLELKSELVRDYADYCSLARTRQSTSSALIAYGPYLGCKDKEFEEEAQEAEELMELNEWAKKGIEQLLSKSEKLRNFIEIQSKMPNTEETLNSTSWKFLFLFFGIVIAIIVSFGLIAGSHYSKDNGIEEVEEFENLPAMTSDSTQNKEKVQSASDSIAVSNAARLLELRSAPIGLRTGAPTYIDLLEFSKEGTNPIVITKFFYTYTTGKGGPNMMFGFVNTSDKTIEHIEFECDFMDNPEEVMHGSARCFYDKPLKPNERTENDYWVWVESGVLRRGLDGIFEKASRMARLNNESFRIARYIILGTIKITYTDGTTVYAYKEKSA